MGWSSNDSALSSFESFSIHSTFWSLIMFCKFSACYRKISESWTFNFEPTTICRITYPYEETYPSKQNQNIVMKKVIYWSCNSLTDNTNVVSPVQKFQWNKLICLECRVHSKNHISWCGPKWNSIIPSCDGRDFIVRKLWKIWVW